MPFSYLFSVKKIGFRVFFKLFFIKLLFFSKQKNIFILQLHTFCCRICIFLYFYLVHVHVNNNNSAMYFTMKYIWPVQIIITWPGWFSSLFDIENYWELDSVDFVPFLTLRTIENLVQLILFLFWHYVLYVLKQVLVSVHKVHKKNSKNWRLCSYKYPNTGPEPFPHLLD